MNDMLTIWKNGDYKVQSNLDASYCSSDPDFLVNINIKSIFIDLFVNYLFSNKKEA